MKTIGVLGGLGPQATIDFEQRVHQVAQRLLPQRDNTGYPPMVVYYYRHPPVLLDATGHPLIPFQPNPKIFDAARILGQVADFLVITSNGVHLLQTELAQAAGRPILSMIDVTLDEVEGRGWGFIGVLGFRTPLVYTQALEKRGLRWASIPVDLQEPLDEAILAVMEGRDDAASVEQARQAVAALRQSHVDGIILGCTEIPLLLQADLDAPDLLNPAHFLAEAAVRQAMA
jgi:aspartate racemase